MSLRRSHKPSAKLQENMEQHQDIIKSFWSAIDASKNAAPKDRQQVAEAIKRRYSRVRTALGDVVPPDMRREADLAIASMVNDGLSVISKVSHSTTRTRSTTASKQQARLEAEMAALQLEHQQREAELEKLARIKQLEAEEAARRASEMAQREAERAQEIARRATEEAEEKKRQLQADKEITMLKQQVEYERQRTELERVRLLDDRSSLHSQKVGGLSSDSEESDHLSHSSVKTKHSARKGSDKGSCHSSNSSKKTRYARRMSSKSEAASVHAELLTRTLETLNISRMPCPEPAVFYGDPLTYTKWKSSFTTLIENRNIPAPERIHFLEKYLGGQAKQAVEGLFFLDTEEAYAKAKAILDKRFGDPYSVTEAFRKKLDDWPKVKGNKELRQFSDFINQLVVAKECVSGLGILDDNHENKKLLKKLPEDLVRRWRRVAHRHKGGYPSFKDFAKFIEEEAEIVNDPATDPGDYKSTTPTTPSKDNKTEGRRFINRDKKEGVRCHNTTATEYPCYDCKKDNHKLENCHFFKRKTPKQRSDLIKDKNLCFACLEEGHKSKYCKNRSTCKTCGRKHPTCLHGDFEVQKKNPKEDDKKKEEQKKSEKNPDSDAATSMNTTSNSAKTTMVVPVYLSSAAQSKEVLVYALLDTQSDTTFVLESVVESLASTPEDVTLKLSTMTNTTVLPSRKYRDLEVRGINSDTRVRLPAAYSRDHIPISKENIPTSETARKWPHLQHLQDKIPPLLQCQVGLLIGVNCPKALAPTSYVIGEENQPFGIATQLGWSIVGGSTSLDCEDTGMVHRFVTREVPQNVRLNDMPSRVDLVFKTTTKEVTSPDVLQALEEDFRDGVSQQDVVMSQEDIQFIDMVEQDIHQNEEGYYEMGLPFKKRPSLPNNRFWVQKRLEGLKRRLLRDQKYHAHYKKFMEDILQHGDAEEVPDEDPKDGVWYIPHHGVYNSKKPDKIRVVFDCSARFHGTALNDHLLQGPDLMNSLIGILCRFRRNTVAFMCDVERMFHQFRVNLGDRDFLRFLWWKDGDPHQEVKTYRMKVHLFGAKSSPGCANFALKQIAKDHEEQYDRQVTSFIMDDFYVDDGLQSVDSAEDAIGLIHGARSLCREGNLRLHKIVCNSRKVMETVPESERAVVKSMDLSTDSPIERALGLEWCLETDRFQFRITMANKPWTRRGILSTVASVFDPLGLLSPFVLQGKQILQQLCSEKMDWDDPLPEDIAARWDKWRQDLINMEDKVRIDRCLVHTDFGQIVHTELHFFADASYDGYGECTYLRCINAEGKVHCALVMGKSRVTPRKMMTIPRLELNSAVLAVQVAKFLRVELKMSIDREFFWTDSRVVLGYIANESKRFHVYVANRVQKIKDSTDTEQWQHVKTGDNPADLASRGGDIDMLVNSNWYHGPAFLWEATLPSSASEDISLQEGDPEVRATVHNVKTVTEDVLIQRIKNFSNWRQAVNGFTRLRRLVREDVSGPITEEERQETREDLFRRAQRDAFPQDVDNLSSKGKVTAHSKLRKLDPFLDEKGLLRVGGRLRKGNLDFGVKHPLVIPQGHLAQLLVKHHHERVSHQGRGMTVGEIRSSGYWILACTKMVSSYIYKCVTCRRLRGRKQDQKMSDLPTSRVEPSPPFTHCGIDCFGPFIVKDGRRELKRYGLLFTCMASRAVHIECLDDMSTDAFINGLRCFIALRGPVRTIYCDRGTNFVGAANELKLALQEVRDDKIRSFLADQHCDYELNTPSSSHMGGVWERQIRTIRGVLNTLLWEHPGRLDTSSLRTFLYEAMAIVNGRPLCPVMTSDPDGPEPLTPNHLLTMKSSIVASPPGHFVKEDVFARKRWRKVQYMANQFWTRWRREYLLQLQNRQKWTSKKRDFKVGDVVLLKEEDLVRNHWRMARVSETLPSEDGCVRKVRLVMSDTNLTRDGKRKGAQTVLDRPIHKLTLLLEDPDSEDSQPEVHQEQD